jgi:hypothetical protein
MSDIQKPIKIRALAMWANLNEPNEMSGKYQVDLTNLSKAAVAALEGLGLDVRKGDGKKEEMGFYITCKSTQPIRLYDSDGTQVNSRMGNGSEVTAVVGAYDWTFKNKKGKSAALKKLVVTNFIAFEGSGDNDAVDVDSGVTDMAEDEVL